MEQEDLQLLILSFSIVLFILVAIFFSLFFLFNKKKTKMQLEQMEIELNFQNELTNTKIEIKEQTLTNVSRELHDNVGQLLSVALMHLNLYSEDKTEEEKNKLENIKTLVTKSLNEIRLLSKLINGDITVKKSFIEAIDDDFERLNSLKKIKCSLNVEGEIQLFTKEKETIIYRILQETITNILKHSHSETLEVLVNYKNRMCYIDIIDTGKGFESDEIQLGTGLTNIRNRAEIIGALLEIYSSKGKGTTIKLSIPFKNEQKNENN